MPANTDADMMGYDASDSLSDLDRSRGSDALKNDFGNFLRQSAPATQFQGSQPGIEHRTPAAQVDVTGLSGLA